MAIVSKNTRQNPIATGLTGTQMIKFIHADRAYIKTSDSSPTPLGEVVGSTNPSGWTDLGIIDGVVNISYTKTSNEVRTGIDEVLRDLYNTKKTGKFEFNLNQFDDVAFGAVFGTAGAHISGTPSGSSAGSGYRFKVGSEDVIRAAFLLVAQDKLTGKEWQFYNPSAFVSFEIADSNGALVLKVTGDCPLFATGVGTEEAIFYQDVYVYDATAV